MIAPARTALVVVDMQVDFAAPEGVVASAGPTWAWPNACRPHRAADRGGTPAGVTVAFLRVMTRPESDSHAENADGAARHPGAEAICRIGSGGEAYYRVAPQPGDIEVGKLAYSGFSARTSTSNCARADRHPGDDRADHRLLRGFHHARRLPSRLSHVRRVRRLRRLRRRAAPLCAQGHGRALLARRERGRAGRMGGCLSRWRLDPVSSSILPAKASSRCVS
jgi:nicotinamidase-related amidase